MPHSLNESSEQAGQEQKKEHVLQIRQDQVQQRRALPGDGVAMQFELPSGGPNPKPKQEPTSATGRHLISQAPTPAMTSASQAVVTEPLPPAAAPARVPRVLRVATSACPPFVLDPPTAGLAAELWRRAAQRNGWTYQLIPLSFPAMLDAVAERTVDVAVSCIGVTPERELSMDFTVPYWTTTLGVVVDPAHGVRQSSAWASVWDILRSNWQIFAGLLGIVVVLAIVVRLLTRRPGRPRATPPSALASSAKPSSMASADPSTASADPSSTASADPSSTAEQNFPQQPPHQQQQQQPQPQPQPQPQAAVDPRWTSAASTLEWSLLTSINQQWDVPQSPSMAASVVAFFAVLFGAIVFTTLFALITSDLTAQRYRDTIQGPGDLHRFRPGAERSTVASYVLGAYGVPYTAYDSEAEAIAALTRGDIHAVVSDRVTLHDLLQRVPEFRQLKLLPVRFYPQQYTFALPPGSPLREDLNRALRRELESDWWDEAVQRTFGANLQEAQG